VAGQTSRPTPPREYSEKNPKDDEDQEVELDSLGHLFNQLADTTSSQEQAETSNADEPEVTLISSDSDSPIPVLKKFRVAVQKVPFSHRDAHLDTQFSLKKAQHTGTSKLKTRSSEGELSGMLGNEPPAQRARTEAPLSPTPSLPHAGHFKVPLHLNDSAYQTSPSSDESSATQAPAFNINPG
jgi:hypothetical protein